jgi:hypothetical protein
MSRLSKNHFWVWFKHHNHEYLALRNKSAKQVSYWLNELNAHLRAYFKFFGYCLEWQQEQCATLIITVNGRSIHFKKVEDFIAKAPKLDGWKISALQEPRPLDFLLDQQIENTGIDPAEMYFSFDNDDPDHTALVIYHPLCNPQNEHLVYELANRVVYNLLGERSYGTDIGPLRIANLSNADPDDIKELEALPACIGLRKSVMAINSNGELIVVD